MYDSPVVRAPHYPTFPHFQSKQPVISLPTSPISQVIPAITQWRTFSVFHRHAWHRWTITRKHSANLPEAPIGPRDRWLRSAMALLCTAFVASRVCGRRAGRRGHGRGRSAERAITACASAEVGRGGADGGAKWGKNLRRPVSPARSQPPGRPSARRRTRRRTWSVRRRVRYAVVGRRGRDESDYSCSNRLRKRSSIRSEKPPDLR